jgi:hypothetical protein
MGILKSAIAIGVFASALQSSGSYRLEEREQVHRTFSNDRTLDVDEVNGFITVTGDGGNTIRVDAEKVIRADTPEEMARGKREVVLDVNEKDGIEQLYVNGPFRDSNHASDNHGFHEHSDRHYDVTYNFTIHVPRATELRLRTINGKIEAQDTTGRFDLHTINGALKMTDVAGSGSAETLNGDTTVKFRENPKADSLFKSFNGKVEAWFQPDLSARLAVKTFNGGAYTDFDTTALANSPMKSEPKNGRMVYKSDQLSRLQVGTGGPELRFETFNGSIHIRKLAR